jgi:hypothetical protein
VLPTLSGLLRDTDAVDEKWASQIFTEKKFRSEILILNGLQKVS